MKKSFVTIVGALLILLSPHTYGSAFHDVSVDFKYIASQQLSVPEQIEKYKKIYDKAYEEFKLTDPDQGAFTFFYNHHVDGLISMLRIGYTSVKSQAQFISNIDTQKKVIAHLDTMLENASFYNIQKKMSQALFLEFNKYFAWFSDYIKSLITGKDQHSKNGEGLDQLKKNIQRVLNYQVQTEDLPPSEKENYLSFYNLPFHIRNFLELEEDLLPVFWPVMILYTHNPIPIDTFVDQRLGYDYPTDIAQFDITLVPREKPTKKDPHFSFFMTTYEMLDHDAFHIGRSLADYLRVPLFEKNDAVLKKIYHVAKDMAPNEKKNN